MSPWSRAVRLSGDPLFASAVGGQDIAVAGVGVAPAEVGVKHNSTLSFFAQRRMSLRLWVDRLSRITWIGAPSGRAARIDFSAARVFAAPSCGG